MIGNGAEGRDAGLCGDPGFGSFEAGGDAGEAGGDAGFALALLIGLGPSQAAGLGGDRDFVCVFDQVCAFRSILITDSVGS
jgi:hypothetical protein